MTMLVYVRAIRNQVHVSLIAVQTDIQIAHPDIVFYDFYGAWDNPIQSDVDAYLGKKD
jgi:hypothetical protein